MTLTTVHDEMEAEAVCGLLRANGIRCASRKTTSSSGLSALGVGGPMGGATEILVAEDDLEAARELLPDA